jgi:uncharacterized membrane-anchored protein YhcB (DUF1043 family)
MYTNFTWILTPLGWLTSMAIGYFVAARMDRRRVIYNIQTQIGMIREALQKNLWVNFGSGNFPSV